MLRHNCKTLAERRTEFHTYKLKEVLKNMHYYINSEDIKIKKLGHTVTNIWILNNTEPSYPSKSSFRPETGPK
jgi:uncharacterized FAD-dependent dehydrogenase